MTDRLEIRTLGGLHIQIGGLPVTGFDSRKVPALLIYLVSTGRTFPREVLAEMLWEERTQAQALSNLRVALHSLNQTLGEYVEITRETVGIRADAPLWLDVHEFETQLSSVGEDMARLDVVMELYRGDFLAGFFVDSSAFEQWVTGERERLRLRVMDGLDSLITGHLAAANYPEGIRRATQLLQLDPLREETYCQMMRLLALSGQRGKALETFETCRHLLDDEFGLTPLPQTLALYEQLRTGELTPGAAPPSGETAPPLSISYAVLTNPYKGLCAFDEVDEADFFGRETLVDRLLGRLVDNHPMARFLAVVGPSGSGKSSVVRAGVIPAVRQGKLPGSAAWPIVTLLPGALPFEELEIALRRTFPQAPPTLIDDLRRDARGLLRAARLCLPDEQQEMVLVIDQFEEVFTLVSDPGEARCFLDSLYTAVTSPRSPVRIIVTLRADFYDRPLMIPDFSELVRQRTEVVTPMTAEELERAVAAPAQRVGVQIEPALLAAVVAEVSQQPGALPMMEYALTEVFERRSDHTLTLATYEAIGGALGALARRANEIYERLSDKRQAAARQMCLRLVTPGEGTEDTRRRALQPELLSAGGDATRAVLHAFDRARLLTFDRDPRAQQPTVELAHEAIIREWGQLQLWLDQSREDVRLQRRLAASAAEWEQTGRDSGYLLTGSRLAQYEDWATQTDLALSLDEHQFLDASSTEARRQKALRRRVRNAILAAAIFVAVGMSILSLFAFGQRNDAQDARATSDANSRLAEANAAEAQELALVNGAQAALNKDDPETALALAVAANRGEHPSAQAQVVLSRAAYPPGPVKVFGDHQGVVWGASFSPDGKTIVTMSDEDLIWRDVESGEILQRFNVKSANFSFTPDSRQLLTASWKDGTIILWDLATGQEVRRYTSDQMLGSFFRQVSVSLDGHTFLSNNGDTSDPNQPGKLLLWDMETGEVIRVFAGHQGTIMSFCVSPDGRRVLSSAQTGEVILWEWETGEIIHRFEPGDLGISVGISSSFGSIVILPDSHRAILRSSDGPMILWDMDSFQVIRSYEIPPDSFVVMPVAVSPDGRKVVTGGSQVDIWDVETGLKIAMLPKDATGVQFSPDGHLVSTANIGEVRLWDWQNGAELQHWTEPGRHIRSFALNPDGHTVLVTTIWETGEGYFCGLAEYDTATGAELWRDASTSLGCINSAISPDGRRLLMSRIDGRIMLWDAETHQPLRTFTGNTGLVYAANFSPDSRTVLTGSVDGTVILWDVETGQEIRRYIGHTQAVIRLDFSPDGRTFLSCSQDSTIILWDVETGQEIRRLLGHTGGVGSVNISPDGRYALSGADEGRVILWDLATGAPVHVLIGHEVGVYQVVFSADGRYALSSDTDSVVILWDLTSGEALRNYTGAGYGPIFDPDGRSFLIADWDSGAIRRFRIDSADGLLAWTLDHRYVRELTCTEREQYNLEPGCDEQGSFPTRTPYPTLQPTAAIPVIVETKPAPLLTVTPTMTPGPALVAHVGEQRGEVAPGHAQVWTYEGHAGELLTIRVNADNPANWMTYGEGTPTPAHVMDSLIIVTRPDGADLNTWGDLYLMLNPPESDDIDLGVNTDSLIEGLVLPEDGTYLIEVSGAGYQTGGAYTLIIESTPPSAITPTPEGASSGE